MTISTAVFAVGFSIFLTYGVVESKLFAMPRILIDSYAAVRSPFFSGYIYCPYCVGFWIAEIIGLYFDLSLGWAVTGPAFILSLLIGRALSGQEFFRPPYEAERAAREACERVLREESDGNDDEPQG